MQRSSLLMLFTLLVLIAFFIVTGDYLVRESISRGEGYAPYSSYRSDPQGVRVLYDALDALPEKAVSRNQTSLSVLSTEGADTTLLFLNATHSKDPEKLIERMEAFVNEGGRLVIAFREMDKEDLNRIERSDKDEEDEETAGKTKNKKKSAIKEKDGEKEKEREVLLDKMQGNVNLEKRWGFDFKSDWEYIPLFNKEIKIKKVKRTDAFPDLSPSLQWRSEGYFTDLAEHWNPIYVDTQGIVHVADHWTPVLGRNLKAMKLADHWTPVYDRGLQAVLIERTMGKGSIVLSTASYPFSNEALRHKRDSPLLQWYIGKSSHVIFDEYTHGVNMDPTIIDLIVRLRLHWFLITLVPLALLHAWRSARPLVPHHDRTWQREAQSLQRGRDAVDGLKNLIQSSVPESNVTAQCLAIWGQCFQRDSKFTPEQRQQAQAWSTEGHAKKAPVETFNNIRKTLDPSNVKEQSSE